MTRFGKLQEKMTIEGNKMRREIDELEEIFNSGEEKKQKIITLPWKWHFYIYKFEVR